MVGGSSNGISLPIDAHPRIPAGANLVPQRFVLLANLDIERGHQVELRARRLGHDLVDDLVGRLRADRNIAGRAMRRAQPRHQHAEVIVNFGHRADRRARRVPHVLLLDGDRGRQPLDMIELRLLHLADELPGIRTEALDIPPLPLGIDRIHRQRTLAGAAEAAADGHLIAGNFDIDPLEVVLPRAADDDRPRLAVRFSARRFASSQRLGRCRGGALVRRRIEIRRAAPGRCAKSDQPPLARACRR